MKCPSGIIVGTAVLFSAFVQAGQVLSSLAEANAFSEDATPREEALVVTGKVLSVSVTPKASEIILADAAGVRAELYRSRDALQPVPGETIEAVGRAFMGKNRESTLLIERYGVLERGPRPVPTPVRLRETDPETHNLATIRTTGVVLDVLPDEIDRRYQILLLKDEDVIVPVSLLRDTFGDWSGRIDATIRVTGIYRQSIGGGRKFSGPNIEPLAPEDLEIVTPQPEDPFAVPVLESRLYLTPKDVLRMTSRVVTGEVLATWSEDHVMLRTAGGQIVHLQLANGVTLPPCGATITAAGQPETDLFRINLAAARWKSAATPVTAPVEHAEEASVSTFWWNAARDAIDSTSHGRLVSARGIVRTLPTTEDRDLRFVLDTGTFSIPVDVTSNPAVLDGLAIGTTVRATGRCLLLTDVGRHDVFPQIRGFALVLRTPADLAVLSRPPWWTPARLLVLLALLVLAVVGLGAWLLLQRHFARLKIVERTRLAVELHDSLSQSLVGVACQVEVGDELIESDPKAAHDCIGAAARMLQSCRAELRKCLFDLRSDMLEETDFTAAIRKALGLLTSGANIAIRFPVRRALFPDSAAHAILSIIRELTANAIRHGKATGVKIAGCTDNGLLKFSVTDNGCGFDPENRPGISDGHFGISGIQDRLKRLNGQIVITSAPAKGTSAVVTLPIHQS